MALKLVQLTDPHLLHPGEMLMDLDVEARWESVLEAAARHDPDAFCLTGDFCAHEPRWEVYARLRPRLDRLGIPYFVTTGNHDDRGMLRQAFGLPGNGDGPLFGIAEVKGYPLLFLDSGPGVVDHRQLDWLEGALLEYPEAPIFVHHPPVPMGVRFMDEKYPLRETGRLLSILTADGRPRRVFCGHYHTPRVVSHCNLEVYLCPPTSFFIRPESADFDMEPHYPGYLLLNWADNGDFHYVQYQVYRGQNPTD